MELDGHTTDFLRVLPTFLHELAHGFRESTRTWESSCPSVTQKKKQNAVHSSHDDGFYECFRIILIEAEKLGIYSLPNRPQKFSPPSLRRFDQIDLAACSLSECGSSKRYSHLCALSSLELRTQIPLLVTTGNAKFKSIILDLAVHTTVDDLLKLAQAKLNCKPKPTTAWTTQGNLITDEMLEGLEPESVVRIGRQKK